MSRSAISTPSPRPGSPPRRPPGRASPGIPTAKDATDLELALDAAIALEPARIVVVGSGGGRLDHLLGSVALLGHERYAGATRRRRPRWGARADRPPHADAERQAGRARLAPAVARPAVGVTTEGLVYPLSSETLDSGTSRGISNLFDGDTATVGVEHGVVTVVRPGEGYA